MVQVHKENKKHRYSGEGATFFGGGDRVT